HTYSGYENKVKANIEKLVENIGMQDVIQEVSVPLMDEVEVKNGKKKLVQHKIFPGYVLVKMVMNDDTWYVVRNTRGVTSFVGPGSKPVPLTEQEVYDMGIETFTLEDIDFAVGDTVVVKAGPFAESSGIVREVNIGKRSVTVGISVFGRETPTELAFDEVQPL
ncbi:MAG: transcription termination/antitermination factor NusG, partial [Firmicutes bacterium]|nr:transcription termination/antitermination factor NusG [Bacillota bacterium]